MDEERLARLACHHLQLPPIRLSRALQHFTFPERLLSSERESLSPFFQPKQIAKICHWQSLAPNERHRQLAPAMVVLDQLNVQLIARTDRAYPSLLNEIPDPPALLYVIGDTAKLKQSQVAMVGSRKFTPGGGKIATSFARQLASAGISITSGLALGIDACAHYGALEVGGDTVAVLGTGIDQRYPRSNKSLYDDMLKQGGVLVSEYPLGTPPKPENFPRRNRIITGLSMGTLVVEASLRSGSLVSARLAAEQGRQVFAVPGSISSPVSEGCHQLIREGATLVTHPSQVLEDLGNMLNLVVSEEPAVASDSAEAPSIKAHWLLDVLGGEILSVDEICERSSRSAQDVVVALTDLEMRSEIAVTSSGYQRI